MGNRIYQIFLERHLKHAIMFCMHIECIYAWISCPLRIHACINSTTEQVMLPFCCVNVLLKQRKLVLYLCQFIVKYMRDVTYAVTCCKNDDVV